MNIHLSYALQKQSDRVKVRPVNELHEQNQVADRTVLDDTAIESAFVM